MMLLEAGFFGHDPSTQKLLDNAYAHFKAFIAAKKIPCSQAPFTKKMVTRFQISNLTSSGIEGGWLQQVTKFVVHSNAVGLK